ncbi:uncharacterized protein LOC129594056 [Paramacrobiotus metropolitanus]|uniref:uncharacterized protein LOC129594056 n=1 Tax=Paramacrobiotus metropolitanus TaxID=2943436 RepID=UPI0024461F84|nr:uncharacterized protein LOC129594056 [Paramacrobiotus metropolitanus]
MESALMSVARCFPRARPPLSFPPLQRLLVRHYPRAASGSRAHREGWYDVSRMSHRIHDPRLQPSPAEFGEYLQEGLMEQIHPEGYPGQLIDERSTRDPADVFRSRQRYKYLMSLRPRHPCLLTIAAREQIRFLHKQDPQEFSVERLSDSFPISPTDLQRLLSLPPRRFSRPESDAAEDARVAQRWKALKTGKKWREWVSAEQMEQFRAGTLRKAHFSGNAALPLPPVVERYVPPPPVDGPVSRLLKTVMEERKRKEVVRPDVEVLVGKELLAKSGSVTVREDPRALQSISAQLRSETQRAPEYQPVDAGYIRPHRFQGVTLTHDPALGDALMDPSVPDIRVRRAAASRHQRATSHADFTGKMLRKLETRSPEVGAAYRAWFQQREPHPEVDAAREERRKDVEVETPHRRIQKFRKNPEKSGKEETGRIVIPEGRKAPGATYRRGDSFYDEDGTFLYRVPGLV